MIRFSAIALFFLHSFWSVGQDAPKAASAPAIPEADFEYRTKSVYDAATLQFEELVKANPKDENIWLNYYKAARYRNYTEHSEKISGDAQKKLEDILARMNNAVPNSYAWNYCSFIQSNRSDKAVAYLKKAYELRPYEQELWDDMLAEATIAGDEISAVDFTKKLEQSAIYSDAAMEYSRNVLSSIEKDGILLTNGNLDTYPILIFQKQHNYRTDVKVICLDWMGSERYTNQVSQSFKLGKGKLNTGQAYTNLAEILKSSKNQNIYLALTIPPDILTNYLSELYCTGLAMKYSKTSLQNLGSLQYNWENLFQINSISAADDINRNYLLPLTLLRDMYTGAGNSEKARQMQARIDEIATRFGLQSVISNSK